MRPTLAAQPGRENLYIAIDAVAWAAAMILARAEDRNAFDFFTRALTQKLALVESSEIASDPTSAGEDVDSGGAESSGVKRWR